MERFIKCKWDDMYLIGDSGTVKTIHKRHVSRFKTDILKGSVKPDGYKMYWLKTKWYYCHQLVAIHFIPNEHDRKEVNHIDGNKLNNCVANLEWSTRQLNIQHSFDVLKRANRGGLPKGFKMSDDARQKMSASKIGKHRDTNGAWY